MGAVSFSIDLTLVELLRRELPLRVFIETGTFEGDTVAQVLPHFEEIETVEISEPHYRAAAERFSGEPSVTVHHDHSPRVLASLRRRLEHEAALYWLDAHWCLSEGVEAAGRSECALLSELEAIETLNADSALLVDDARLFLCTPPQPHEASDWPTLHKVAHGLRALSSEHDAMVINDVIVLYPRRIAGAVSEYARSHSIDWLVVLTRLRALEEALPARMADIEEIRAEQYRLYDAAHEREAVIEQLRHELADERARNGTP